MNTSAAMLRVGRFLVLVVSVGVVSVGVVAAQDETPSQTFITNVNVWDGNSEALQMGTSVLIEGNLVAGVGASANPSNDATIIDGGGRTLLPGLIDMHSHLCFDEAVEEANSDYDQMAIGAFTGQFMVDYLQQGFTTVRDAGCNILSIARAVNRGRIPGP